MAEISAEALIRAQQSRIDALNHEIVLSQAQFIQVQEDHKKAEAELIELQRIKNEEEPEEDSDSEE
jgi:hypothetical protein